MPEEYASEASSLASAEELNLLYALIPHKSGMDKFHILASCSDGKLTKYYLIALLDHGPLSSGVDPDEYLIARTSHDGVKVYYRKPGQPFAGGFQQCAD